MTADDTIYVFILILSLILGPIVQRCGGFKSLFSALFGFIMVFCILGDDVWHSIVIVLGYSFILNIAYRR